MSGAMKAAGWAVVMVESMAGNSAEKMVVTMADSMALQLADCLVAMLDVQLAMVKACWMAGLLGTKALQKVALMVGLTVAKSVDW